MIKAAFRSVFVGVRLKSGPLFALAKSGGLFPYKKPVEANFDRLHENVIGPIIEPARADQAFFAVSATADAAFWADSETTRVCSPIAAIRVFRKAFCNSTSSCTLFAFVSFCA